MNSRNGADDDGDASTNLLFASREKNWVQLLTLLRVVFPLFVKMML
jgi:hypothetical protein